MSIAPMTMRHNPNKLILSNTHLKRSREDITAPIIAAMAAILNSLPIKKIIATYKGKTFISKKTWCFVFFNKRLYYKLLKKIVSEGQKKGELTDEITVNEIVRIYAMSERALIYDWCLCGGEYSLVSYAKKVMPMYLSGITK